eukprot:1136927-Pelagomonas_calceolata.AAC.13
MRLLRPKKRLPCHQPGLARDMSFAGIGGLAQHRASQKPSIGCHAIILALQGICPLLAPAKLSSSTLRTTAKVPIQTKHSLSLATAQSVNADHRSSTASGTHETSNSHKGAACVARQHTQKPRRITRVTREKEAKKWSASPLEHPLGRTMDPQPRGALLKPCEFEFGVAVLCKSLPGSAEQCALVKYNCSHTV